MTIIYFYFILFPIIRISVKTIFLILLSSFQTLLWYISTADLVSESGFVILFWEVKSQKTIRYERRVTHLIYIYIYKYQKPKTPFLYDCASPNIIGANCLKNVSTHARRRR